MHFESSLPEFSHCLVVTASSAKEISPAKQIDISNGFGVSEGDASTIGLFVGTGVVVMVGNGALTGIYATVGGSVGGGVQI